MTESGWITLHRKLLDWEWFDDANCLKFFIYCLLRANHKSRQWRGITVHPGEFITSRENLAHDLRISIQSVRTLIKRLKSTGELTSRTTNKYTIISITNWKDYQNINQQANHQLTINQPATNQQLTTDNNENNVNNDNNTTMHDFALEPPKDKPPRKAVPYQKILTLYHDILPELPKVEMLTAKRKGQISARHRDLKSDLKRWENFFHYVRESDFLMGRIPPTQGRKQFIANLEWLTNETNFAKIAEDTYHRG